MRDEYEAGIERHIEPFMSVRGPGIRLLHSIEQMAMSLARRDPEAEGTVDMHPGVRGVGERTSAREMIEDARVQIPGLKPKDLRIPAPFAKRFLELADIDAPPIVGCNVVDRIRADASSRTDRMIDSCRFPSSGFERRCSGKA